MDAHCALSIVLVRAFAPLPDGGLWRGSATRGCGPAIETGVRVGVVMPVIVIAAAPPLRDTETVMVGLRQTATGTVVVPVLGIATVNARGAPVGSATVICAVAAAGRPRSKD